VAEKKPVDHEAYGSDQRNAVALAAPVAAKRPGEQTQSRPKRRLKAPTTVLVTLLVALLSVAVGPALARQWDDRQRARELQVQLIELVWSTTAHIQAELRTFGYSQRQDPWPIRDAIFDGWEVPRLEVETKLRVYYGEQGVNAWRSYVRAVKGLAVLAAYEAGTPDRRSWRRTPQEPVCFNGCSLEPNEYIRRIAPPGDTQVSSADNYIAIFSGAKEEKRKLVLGHLSRLLANQASAVVDLILRKGPRGFSTTRHDLLRDLLP
jgi:hypothetical protein